MRKIAENVCYPARQGIALRGGGVETDGNFTQLLLLRGEDDEWLMKWIERKAEKYASPEIQNELLSILASGVSRGIARDIREDGISPSMSD